MRMSHKKNQSKLQYLIPHYIINYTKAVIKKENPSLWSKMSVGVVQQLKNLHWGNQKSTIKLQQC